MSPAFPFSPAMATVATERKNGNDTTECHNGTTEWLNRTAKTAEQQRNGGNQALLIKRHKSKNTPFV